MNKNYYQAAVLVVIGIALGFALGRWGVIERSAWRCHPQKHWGERFQCFRRDLGLSEDQAQKVNAVLEKAREEKRRLMESLKPQFDGLFEKTRAEIRKHLTPEQIAKLEKLEKEREGRKRGRGFMKGPGVPPPQF